MSTTNLQLTTSNQLTLGSDLSHLLTTEDTSIRVDNTVYPLFSITQDTIKRVHEFRNTHPDIDQELFSKELNLTIKELLFRMSREFEGNV